VDLAFHQVARRPPINSAFLNFPQEMIMQMAKWAFAAGMSIAVFTTHVSAALISDPTGDFLPTYIGAHTPDLDVVSATVIFDGTNFIFRSVQAGAVGTTPSAFYVWGINRGQGTPRLALITGGGSTYDASNVLFDSTLAIRPNGISTVSDLLTGPPTVTTILAANIHATGNELVATIPASLFPSRGFSFAEYGFNLWPRDANIAGNVQISDFAPDNSTFLATITVPEPDTLPLVVLATGVSFWLQRRRSPQTG